MLTRAAGDGFTPFFPLAGEKQILGPGEAKSLESAREGAAPWKEKSPHLQFLTFSLTESLW
jgi:hypothetical protein